MTSRVSRCGVHVTRKLAEAMIINLRGRTRDHDDGYTSRASPRIDEHVPDNPAGRQEFVVKLSATPSRAVRCCWGARAGGLQWELHTSTLHGGV